MERKKPWAPHAARIHHVIRHWVDNTPDNVALEDDDAEDDARAVFIDA